MFCAMPPAWPAALISAKVPTALASASFRDPLTGPPANVGSPVLTLTLPALFGSILISRYASAGRRVDKPGTRSSPPTSR